MSFICTLISNCIMFAAQVDWQYACTSVIFHACHRRTPHLVSNAGTAAPVQVHNIQPLLHRCYGYLDSAMVQELLQDRLQGLVHQMDVLAYSMCKVGTHCTLLVCAAHWRPRVQGLASHCCC